MEIQVHKVQEGTLDHLDQEERLERGVHKGTLVHEANEGHKDRRVMLDRVVRKAIQLPFKVLSG